MRAIEKTEGVTKTADKNWIGIIAKAESLKLPFSEVLYIVQVGKILHIHKDNDLIRIPGRIKRISMMMGEPFFQCHSYLIINLSRVHAMTRGEIIFDNQMTTHVGERSYYKARKKFNQYLLGEEQYDDQIDQKTVK